VPCTGTGTGTGTTKGHFDEFDSDL
jgi:hypothetical protein